MVDCNNFSLDGWKESKIKYTDYTSWEQYPNWDDDVKDVNDAVIKYGKLPTLLSILQCATNSKIKIEMKRKKIGKAGN